MRPGTVSYNGAALLMAAGDAERYQGKVLKYFAHLDHKPLFVYAADQLAASKRFYEIILVSHPDWIRLAAEHVNDWQLDIVRIILPGSTSVWDSLRHAVDHLQAAYEVIAIHDVARILTPPDLIAQAMDAAYEYGVAVPVVELAAAEPNEEIEYRFDNKDVRIQGPLCIRKELLEEVLKVVESETREFSDLFDVLRFMDLSLYCIFHDYDNPRVVFLDDMDTCMELLRKRAGKR